MRKIFVLVLIFLLAPINAQAFGIKKTMAEIMDSWVGAPINSVINHWGYPTNEKTMAGKTLYYWDWEYTVRNPAYTNAQANTYGNTTNINAYTYGGGTRNVYCNRILEVNDSGKVVSWQWSGNNCPYTKVRLYKEWMNPRVLNEVAYQKYQKSLDEQKTVTAKYLESLKEKQNK